MRTTALRLTGLIIAIVSSACITHQTDVPALSGPSSHALNVNVSATPDRISQDGSSRSSIAVQVFGADGRPLSGVTVRLDMKIGAELIDFGTLDARTVVTGSDGTARTVYTAPPQGPDGTNVITTVSVVATPVGSDSQTALPSYHADISLMPVGLIVPPSAIPVSSFTASTATLGDPVTFDGTASTATKDASGIAATIKSYAWDFGDGSAGSGPLVTHTFRTTGPFLVTLTVTNSLGLSASSSKTITVTAVDITGAFLISPTPVVVSLSVIFNAGPIQTAPNHNIVAYDWNFGDGDGNQPTTGMVVSHTFARAGTYQVVLAVTDDLGRRKSFTQSVNVTDPAGGSSGGVPTADFSFLPASPTSGSSVTFNAAASTAPTGSTITTYTWTFEDTNTQATGVTTTHTFGTPGPWKVTLTVIDNTGRAATVQKTITVS